MTTLVDQPTVVRFREAATQDRNLRDLRKENPSGEGRVTFPRCRDPWSRRSEKSVREALTQGSNPGKVFNQWPRVYCRKSHLSA
ncbi:hypothetical protein SK128_001644 [Halocaridina rubra]|uniref:Uncharacterized protein n=1 Tax=Halocaridina rubra TaxID=373956 RepID=A0AAN8WPV4_HALRR